MFRILILFHFFFLSVWYSCTATQICKEDRNILQNFWKYAKENKLADLPVNERIPYVARFFLNVPYKGNTLNVAKENLPVINLRELDCVTFIENVLALSFLPDYNSGYESVFVKNIDRKSVV